MNCLNCSKETSNPKFCSHSCSATFTQKGKPSHNKRNPLNYCPKCDRRKKRIVELCRRCTPKKIFKKSKIQKRVRKRVRTRKKESNTFRINGPYLRKDGRKHLVIVDRGKKTTMSYPKYLMEQHLGRKLLPNETVDHIDCDFTNDDISNLRVIDRSQHVKEDNKRLVSQKFECPLCHTEFKLSGSRLRGAVRNRRQGYSGPFCSRLCAGKYSRAVQLGRREKLPVVEIVREYTTLKELNKNLKRV